MTPTPTFEDRIRTALHAQADPLELTRPVTVGRSPRLHRSALVGLVASAVAVSAAIGGVALVRDSDAPRAALAVPRDGSGSAQVRHPAMLRDDECDRPESELRSGTSRGRPANALRWSNHPEPTEIEIKIIDLYVGGIQCAEGVRPTTVSYELLWIGTFPRQDPMFAVQWWRGDEPAQLLVRGMQSTEDPREAYECHNGGCVGPTMRPNPFLTDEALKRRAEMWRRAYEQRSIKEPPRYIADPEDVLGLVVAGSGVAPKQFPGGGKYWFGVVLADPTMVVEYAADGDTFVPATLERGAYLLPRDPEMFGRRTIDQIRVRDGAGNVIHTGRVDESGRDQVVRRSSTRR